MKKLSSVVNVIIGIIFRSFIGWSSFLRCCGVMVIQRMVMGGSMRRRVEGFPQKQCLHYRGKLNDLHVEGVMFRRENNLSNREKRIVTTKYLRMFSGGRFCFPEF